MARAVGVVLGAGSGSRVGARANKVYLPLAGRRLVSWSLNAFLASPAIDDVVLVVREAEVDTARAVVEREVSGAVDIVVGGATRHESEHAALSHLRDGILGGRHDVVAIHDGARPLLSGDLIRDVVATARLYGGAVPAIALDDVADLARDGVPSDALPAGQLVRVQTPQAFRAPGLLAAYDRAARDGFAGTDTAMCVEHYSDLRVHVLRGSARNIKVTFAGDLFLAERLLAEARHHAG